MSKSEWSGWVQAIGSILAIAGAAVLLYLQLRITKRQAIEAEHRRLVRRHNAIHAVATFAETTVRHLCTAASAQCQVQGAFEWQSDADHLELARQELETVRSAELEAFHLVRGTRRLAVCVRNALLIDAELTRGGGGPGTLSGIHQTRIDAWARKVAEEAAAALYEVRSALTELMEDPGIGLPYFSPPSRKTGTH
jgi:hypothetical protein